MLFSWAATDKFICVAFMFSMFVYFSGLGGQTVTSETGKSSGITKDVFANGKINTFSLSK